MNRPRLAAGVLVLSLVALLAWLLRSEPRVSPPPSTAPPKAAPTAPLPVPTAPPPPASTPPQVAEGPPDPISETPESPTTPATGPSLATIVVKDMADGNPVAGLAFELTLAPETGSAADPEVLAEATTDALGRLEVDEKRLRDIRPKPKNWLCLGSRNSVEETIRNGAWVYRILTILATVEVEGEDETFRFDSITARLATVPDDLARGETSGLEPFRARSAEWHRRRRVGDTFSLKPDSSHRLRVKCPWIGGGSIAFSHPGWISVLVPLEGVDPAVESRVTLRFRRALRVRGVVRDRDGKPQKGICVRLFTTRKGTYEEGDAMIETARNAGGGLTAARSVSRDESRVTLVREFTTGPAGTFELSIHQDGESLLLIWEQSFAPFHRTLGPLHNDLDVGEVVLQGPATTAQVQVLWEGKPQREGELTLGDFRFPDAQPAFSVTLDEEGRFPASLLVPEGEYSFGLRGAGVEVYRSRWLQWKGEGVIDLGKLRLVTDVLTERAR
jgi:hypothetical protein